MEVGRRLSISSCEDAIFKETSNPKPSALAPHELYERAGSVGAS